MPGLPSVNPADHIEGGADARFTLVQYGDFQCPACIQAFSFVHQMRERHRGQMSFVFRHFPLLDLHPQALAAAVATEVAAESGAFWPLHDRLYALAGELDTAALLQAAVDAGPDPLGFSAMKAEARFEQRVMDQLDGGRHTGVRATPSFFLDGRLVDTSFGYEALHRAVAQAAAGTRAGP